MIKTSLYDNHIKAGAKMVPFAGFEMPIQYSSLKEEALAIRNEAGIFDVSHMGEFFVTGEDAIAFTDYIMTNDFKGAAMGKAVYSPLCRENGTVVDDLIAYKLGEKEVLICVNASNIEKDWNHISQFTSKFNIELTNQSDDFSLLAIQGPKTKAAMKELGLAEAINLEIFSLARYSFNNSEVIVARTGYTGEDGFEIFCNHETAKAIWEKSLKSGIIPCGLGSRDVLRIEACYPLYGHEINDEVTPLDAGLRWTVKFTESDFVGKDSLSSYQPKYKLIKLIMDKGIPREGYKVFNTSGDEVGIVVSGTMSVLLGKGVALAHIAHQALEDSYIVEIRNRQFESRRLKKSFLNEYREGLA